MSTKKVQVILNRNISSEKLTVIKSALSDPSFQIETIGNRFGFGGLDTVITFLVGAVLSGVTWDALKTGLIKLHNLFKNDDNNQITLKIKQGKKILKITSETFQLTYQNTTVEFNTLEDIILELTKES